jgi:hypothetical protein
MYKNLFVAFVVLFFSSLSFGFDFHEPDIKPLLVKTTNEYNKNLNSQDFFKSTSHINKNFINDFKSYVESSKVQKFWKADLIGDTVYFKNKQEMVSIKVLEVVTNSRYTIKMNGKTVSIELQDGFAKNLAIMKSTFNSKTATVWDLIIPRANADDIKIPNKDLEQALSSSLGFLDGIWAACVEDMKVEKERFCKLYEKEKNNTISPAISDDRNFEEIKYFIKIQNHYTKPEIQSCGTESCPGRGDIAKEFQNCLIGLAELRKKAIETRDEKGFSCFTKYELGTKGKAGGLYLNSNILSEGLIDKSESFSAKLAKLDQVEKYCDILPEDYQVSDCKKSKRINLNREKLSQTCPSNEQTARAAEAANELANNKSSGSSMGGK